MLKIQDLDSNILKIQDLDSKILKIQDLTSKMLKIQDLDSNMLKIQDLDSKILKIQDLTSMMLNFQRFNGKMLKFQDLDNKILKNSTSCQRDIENSRAHSLTTGSSPLLTYRLVKPKFVDSSCAKLASDCVLMTSQTLNRPHHGFRRHFDG